MTALVWLDHPGQDKTPGFPLYMLKADYEKWVKDERAERLLRPVHLEMVRELQPYVDLAKLPPARGGILNALRNFDNMNKHQVVHVAYAMGSAGIQTTRPELRGHPAVESHDWHVGEDRSPLFIVDGDPYVRVRFRPGVAIPTFVRAPHPTIAFGEEKGQHWDVRLMRNFGGQVARLIDRFYDTMA